VTVLDSIRTHAASRPDAAAIVTAQRGGENATLSYGELIAAMDAAADELREAGVVPGERCGLVARQGPAFIERALGVLAAGACVAPIPDDHKGAVLDAFVRRARLHWLVHEEANFAAEPGPAGGPVDGAGDAEFRALDPAYLRFTSGTTNVRKGVILGHRAIEERVVAANRALAVGPEDRILWLLPMAHHFVVSILLYLRHGATILLPSSSLAQPVLELAGAERATVFYASPYHYHLLGKDASELGLPDVRLAVSTAEGLRAEVAERFAGRFGRPLSQALGIIEVGLPVLNVGHAADKPTALGRPLPDYDVWLRAEDGSPVTESGSPERTGEVCIRGPGLFDAYLDPWLPAPTLLGADGFRTGDQGWFDADGDLHLAGRRTNRINMAGMKFFSEEVEAVIDEMPGVERSRVISRDHPKLGEIPVAEIVAANSETPPSRKELMTWCRERLPGYKIPREFKTVDSLPMTATGKLGRTTP